MSAPKTQKPQVNIWTDGSVYPNPGAGGWAALLQYTPPGGEMIEREIYGGTEEVTTNNRMELTAVLEALGTLTRPCTVTIYTDSQLVIGWLARGWKCKIAENAALCREIYPLLLQHTVTFEHVKGHAGHVNNERVDSLARSQLPHHQ